MAQHPQAVRAPRRARARTSRPSRTRTPRRTSPRRPRSGTSCSTSSPRSPTCRTASAPAACSRTSSWRSRRTRRSTLAADVRRVHPVHGRADVQPQLDVGRPDERAQRRGVEPVVERHAAAAHARRPHAAGRAGTTRARLQRFMQLLHDANGLDVCTKPGAVAHIQLNLNTVSAIFPNTAIPIDYPTNAAITVSSARFVGAPAPPNPLPQCGILRIQNVDALLLDVALGRAKFDIRDPCLQGDHELVAHEPRGRRRRVPAGRSRGSWASTRTRRCPGVARLVYFDTPHGGDDGRHRTPARSDHSGLPLRACSIRCRRWSASRRPSRTPTGPSSTSARARRSRDTLAGRDPGYLFPIEEFNFVQDVQPLAAAFDDHGASLHLRGPLRHAGRALGRRPGSRRPSAIPRSPATDARWCSQDGAVTYEPLLSDVLTNTDLFQALHDTVPIIQSTMVTHCDQQDPMTHALHEDQHATGVQVLAQAVRVMVDPALQPGPDRPPRRADGAAQRRDHQPAGHAHLPLLHALNEIDATFATWAQAHPERRPPAHVARRALAARRRVLLGRRHRHGVDLGEPAIPAILPPLARRPTVADPRAVPRPVVARGVPLLDAADAAEHGRRASAGPRSRPSWISSTPSARATRRARSSSSCCSTCSARAAIAERAGRDPGGVGRRDADPRRRHEPRRPSTTRPRRRPGRAGAPIRGQRAAAWPGGRRHRGAGARLRDRARRARGSELCSKEVDPNDAIAAILGNFVTPIEDSTQSARPSRRSWTSRPT